ncbi:MAG: hypothetical protein ABL996_21660 [Micropepsaceae bacterium]
MPDNDGASAIPSEAPMPTADAFFKAATLARRRRYADAGAVLHHALEEGHCSQAEALDLQARMFVQQGRLLDAEICWTKAQAVSGPGISYAAEIALLREQARPSPFHLLLVGGTVAAILLVAISLLGWNAARDSVRQVAELEKAMNDRLGAMTEAQAGQAAGLLSRLAAIDARVAAVSKVEDVAASRTQSSAEIARVETAVLSLARDATRLGEISGAVSRLDDKLGQSESSLSSALYTMFGQLNKRIDEIHAAIDRMAVGAGSASEAVAPEEQTVQGP